MSSRIFLQSNLRITKKLDPLKHPSKSPQKPDSKPSRYTPSDRTVSPFTTPNLSKLCEITKVSFTKQLNPPKQIISSRQLQSALFERSSSITRRFRPSNLNSSKSLQSDDPLPAFPSKTFYNERLVWKKRKVSLPLCVINFNGVIGEFHRPFFKSSVSGQMNLVAGVKQGLEILSASFLVAVVCWSSRNDTKQVIEYFEQNEFRFDAFYIVRHRNYKCRFRHNYMQIVQDFQIKNVKECVVMCPLTLSWEEVEGRKGAELFYEASLSGTNRFTPIGLPVLCEDYEFDPLCVLVPHSQASSKRISFLELARFLKNAVLIGVEGVQWQGRINLPCEHEKMHVIPQKPENVGVGIKFLVYLNTGEEGGKVAVKKNWRIK